MRPCVLVTDPDDATRYVLRLVLEDAGYAVEEAKDGLLALASLRLSREPLVALLNYSLPGMSGQQVLEVVAAFPMLALRHGYVLMMPARTTHLPHPFTRLLRDLEVPVLPQPFPVEALLDVIGQARARVAVHQLAD